MIFGKSHHYAVVLALSAFLVVPLVGCGGGGSSDTASPTPDPALRAVFTGRVVDSLNDLAVPGALVSFNGVSGYTENDGSFRLDTPATSAAAYATVVGPNNYYYSTGSVNGTAYNVVNPGFPVPATSGGQSRDLGTIKISSQDGPPPPPPI